MVQSEQYVIYRLAGGAREAQADTEETDGKRLLTAVNPQERSNRRSGVRSAMCAARQLPGRGPTDVDDGPAPATELKKIDIYDYDYSMAFFTCLFIPML